MKMKNRSLICMMFFAVFVSACGGGGGGGGLSPAPNPPPSNQAPTANAGTDQSVDEGTTVNLSATGTDSDGTIASYSWQQESGAAVTITNADMANASFGAPMVAASEVLVFGVTVTDDDGATGSDTVTVTVNDIAAPPPSNQAPTANAGADQSVEEGTTANLSATGADSDGTIVSYGWQQESGTTVTITNADMANASFLAPAFTATEALVFSVTLTDDDGATGSDTVTVTVNDIAAPPQPPSPPEGNFIPLGDLMGGEFYSRAMFVSADGSVVVGGSTGTSGGEVFRWTSATGMVRLFDRGNNHSIVVESASDDGDVVVGWFQAVQYGDIEAFRWTSASGMVGLGGLRGNSESEAFDVSANGSVVLGHSGREAFRWTSAGGMVGLGDLPPSVIRSDARAVSADGSVVVGFGSGDFQFEATRWTSATGMVGLGDLPGGNLDSRALDVSADGSVIAGNSSGASGVEAVLWTSAGGMMGLGYLPGRAAESRAFGVSADGTVVVGESSNIATGGEAFVWTQADGMQSLRDVLIASGVTGLDNWELFEATSISADGVWVVGTGTNPSGYSEAFLANIAAP